MAILHRFQSDDMSQEDYLRILKNKFDDNFQQLCTARKALMSAIDTEEVCKEGLRDRETALLLLGKIDGKNQEIRDAQMRDATLGERSEVLIASREKTIAEYKLQLCLDARRNLESLLKIEEIGKR